MFRLNIHSKLIMISKPIVLFFVFHVIFGPLFAQTALSIDTTFRSIYSEPFFGQQLFRYEADIAIESKVVALCQAAGIAKDFELVASNVTTVAVVNTAQKRYLLYGSFFFWSNESDPGAQYIVLAHAIGHFINRHSLSPQKRIFEEVSADEKAGWLLYQIQNVEQGITFESLTAALEKLPFGYQEVLLAKRREAFERGWRIADGQLNARKSAGFYYNENNIETLPLPRFWQDGSPSIYRDNNNKLSRTFTPTKTPTIGKADELIQNALKRAGFQQWSYYVVNGGFALITQVEQFDYKSPLAKSISGDYRWRDTPPEENISTILSYLKDILWPRNGYFRFFVFVVSNQPIPKRRTEVRIDPAIVEGLMKQGSSALTEEIARLKFTQYHKVTILVYEMEVKESTKMGSEKSPPLFQPEKHLEGSGILGQIR